MSCDTTSTNPMRLERTRKPFKPGVDTSHASSREIVQGKDSPGYGGFTSDPALTADSPGMQRLKTARSSSLSGLPISGGPRYSGGQSLPPLDPLESSSQPRNSTADDEDPVQFINPDAVPFEHRGWMPMRRRVMASMIRTDQPGARRHAFWHCSERVHVYHAQDMSDVELRPETCHDRFCMVCGKKRSHRIAHAVEGLMKEATGKLMFITLTVRGRPDDRLEGMLDRLRDAWKELRRLKGWKNTIKGGVVMLEVKWSSTSGGHWHPHYHLICEGSWLDESWLQQAWKLLTRDSDQVKVKRVTEAAAALSYISKYASKPVDASFVMRPRLIDEAMTALKGVRLAACYGTWYGTPLSERITDDDSDDTEMLTAYTWAGTIDDIRTRAGAKDKAAVELLLHVERLLRLRHTLSNRCRSPASHDSHVERPA